MNNQKNKNQGRDDRSDKLKQQSNKNPQKGSQHAAGYKPENPDKSKSGKEEQPPRPMNSSSQSSTTTRPGEKPSEPGEKPIRPVEGDESSEELYDHEAEEEGKRKRGKEETAF
jgi:hypothetical protein